MNRKGFGSIIVLLVVVAILIVGGIWYWQSHPSQNQTPTNTSTTSTTSVATSSLNVTPAIISSSSWLMASGPIGLYGIGPTIIENGYAYVFGGLTGPGSGWQQTSTIFYAKLDSNTGAPGDWLVEGSIPTNLYPEQVLESNGFTYLIGTTQQSSGTMPSFFYSKIDPNTGRLGVWLNATSPSAAIFGASLTNGSYMYILGGQADGDIGISTSAIYYAAMNSTDGALGNWSIASYLPDDGWCPDAEHDLESDNYIYQICDGANYTPGQHSERIIYHTTINSTGALGAWSSSTVASSLMTNFSIMRVVNNSIYSIGGMDGISSETSTIAYASINLKDGGLGDWHFAGSLPSISINEYENSAITSYSYGRYIYIFGVQQSQPLENNGSPTWFTTTYYTTINSS